MLNSLKQGEKYYHNSSGCWTDGEEDYSHSCTYLLISLTVCYVGCLTSMYLLYLKCVVRWSVIVYAVILNTSYLTYNEVILLLK